MVILLFVMAKGAPEIQSNDNTVYYLVGAGAVVAIAAGMYFFRPQQTTSPQTTTPVAEQQTPPLPTGPISTLACEQQYYNPVVGFPKYFLGVRGADVKETKEVNCEFTVRVGGNTVATDTAKATFTAAPERGGQIFNCRTKAIELSKNVPTNVDVQLENDAKVTIGCSRIFQLP